MLMFACREAEFKRKEAELAEKERQLKLVAEKLRQEAEAREAALQQQLLAQKQEAERIVCLPFTLSHLHSHPFTDALH